MKKPLPALLLALFVFGCGEKSPPPVAQPDCEAQSVTSELLAEFAGKLKDEGVKGYATAAIKELLLIKAVTPVQKAPQDGYSKCAAKLAIKYPPEFSEKVALAFASAKTYEAFKTELEDRYGVVNGAGMHAQLMYAVTDGPFGTVPVTPDPATVNKYQKTIQKNLDAVIAEQLDIAVSYELTTGVDPNGKPSQKLKWQINKREAMDINVALMSIGSLH